MIKILFADDHKLFRQGIVSLLSDVANFTIVGEAENGRELQEKYFETNPDVVLCDISMPLGTGPEIIQKLKNKGAKPKVLFLSMHTGEEYIYYALKAGGLGMLSKSIIKEDLVSAIISVYEEKKYFAGLSDDELNAIVDKYSIIENKEKSFQVDPLTRKEMEVLELVGEGLTSVEIAERLKISKRTVDSHRTKIMDKLYLKSLPAFIKYAIEYKLRKENNDNI